MQKATAAPSPVQGAIAHRLLRRRQVEQAIGLSRSSIYSRLDPKSPHYDPAFPKPIKQGKTLIAFIENEVQEYISHLIAVSRKGA